MVEILLHYGADINLTEEDGTTVKDVAKNSENSELIKLIDQYGINFRLKNNLNKIV